MKDLDVNGERLELEDVPCDVCGGTRFRPLASRMRHDVNLPTVVCEHCSLCFTNPRPTPEANARFYRKHYSSFHGQFTVVSPEDPYVKRSAVQAAPRVELLKGLLDPTTPHTVFEIGTGAGQFQRLARAGTRWDVKGIEPGEQQFELCTRHLGLNVRHMFLEDVPVDEPLVDAVVSFHVLEHALSPVAFLQRARKLLKPDGLLYLEVPNLERPETALTEFLQLPHFYNFTALSLRNVLAKAGFAPRYWKERTANLSVVASPSDERPIERADVDALCARLRDHDRLVLLSRVIPNVGPLKKVRSTIVSM